MALAIPLVLVPVLSKLFESGLDMLGRAVMAKGKDVIEKQLGVDLSDSVKSEDGLLKLKALEIENEQFLIRSNSEAAERDFRIFQAEVDDRASARDMNKAALSSGDKFNSRFVAGLTIGLLLFGGAYIIAASFIPTEKTNEAVVLTVLGFVMSTMITAPLAFYYGTTNSSKKKDETIQNLSSGSNV